MDLDSASIGMLAALIILVVFSAYFSATETAVTSLNLHPAESTGR